MMNQQATCGYRAADCASRLRRSTAMLSVLCTVGLDGQNVANPPWQGANERRIVGIVRDSSGAPVEFAVIEESASRSRVPSDRAGQFSLLVPMGRPLSIAVRRIGYAPAVWRLPAGGDTTIEVTLMHLARSLSEVVVKGERAIRALELRGFYRRLADRERGILNGEFITVEEIEQRRPVRITQMLDGVQGVRVRYGGGHALNWLVLGPGGCTMTVFLDGIRLNSLRSAGNAMSNTVDELVSPTAVAGVEIYRSAGRAPPEYQSFAAQCGVVLIWTR